MSEQVAEPACEAVEPLPPFSFSKKPIKAVYNESGISQILHQHCPDQKGPTSKPSLNNINYDEQIRAPRMTVPNHYTHLAQAEISEPGKTPDEEVRPKSPEKPYMPATFDLNAPTRHNLLPLRRDSLLLLLDTYFPGLLLPNSEKSASSESTAWSQTRTPELAGLTLKGLRDLLKIQRALLNLSENVTTAERVGPTEYPARRQRPSNGHLVDARGPSLRQVYSMKKPLCTPAVLRPASETQLAEHADLEALSPELNIKEYPFQMPAAEETHPESLTEPTHAHWKPNNSSDYCTKCFEEFGNFFSPQRKRRHHCRFCGFLFCVDCLFKTRETDLSSSAAKSPAKRSGSGSSSLSGYSVFSSITASLGSSEQATGVMMDGKARLVVPIFANLSQFQDDFGSMRQRFKVCKICKFCGVNYLRLVQALNLRVERAADEVTVPYAFIENPYLCSGGATPGSTFEGGFSNLGCDGAGPRFGQGLEARRRSSTGNNVPLDWTWSSF